MPCRHRWMEAIRRCVHRHTEVYPVVQTIFGATSVWCEDRAVACALLRQGSMMTTAHPGGPVHGRWRPIAQRVLAPFPVVTAHLSCHARGSSRRETASAGDTPPPPRHTHLGQGAPAARQAATTAGVLAPRGTGQTRARCPRSGRAERRLARPERRLQGLPTPRDRQGDRHGPGQHRPAAPVDHRHPTHPPARQADSGERCAPDLVDPVPRGSRATATGRAPGRPRAG